jgi:hypothetical protein
MQEELGNARTVAFLGQWTTVPLALLVRLRQ